MTEIGRFWPSGTPHPETSSWEIAVTLLLAESQSNDKLPGLQAGISRATSGGVPSLSLSFGPEGGQSLAVIVLVDGDEQLGDAIEKSVAEILRGCFEVELHIDHIQNVRVSHSAVDPRVW